MVETVEVGVWDAHEESFQRGWTDGLPVVPPRPELVEAMITAVTKPAAGTRSRPMPSPGTSTAGIEGPGSAGAAGRGAC